MSRRRGHGSTRRPPAAPVASPGGGTSQGIVVLNAPRPSRDPALPLSATSDYTAAEAPTGLTPETLAGYLDDYYAGTFAGIAKTWEVLERRTGPIAVARAKRLLKIQWELRNYEIVAFDDSPEAERHAEFLRGFYERLRAVNAIDATEAGGLDVAVRFICDAIGKQYSCLARSWTEGGEALTLTLKHVPLWYFRRERDRLQILPMAGAGTGMDLDPTQWVIANTGRAVMEPCSITALWQRLPVRQLVNILETWGRPSIYAKTNHAPDSAARETLMDALQALISGWTGILGGGDSIEQIKAELHTASLHMPWIEYCSREETTLWLHSHLGTTAEGDTGNLAGGAQADDTAMLIGSDCEWLTGLFRTQVDGDALRFGLGAPAPLAGFQLRKPDAQDDAGDLDRFERGANMGVPIPISHFRERFSIPEPDGDEPILEASSGGGMPGLMGNAAGALPLTPPRGRVPSDTPGMRGDTAEAAGSPRGAILPPGGRIVENRSGHRVAIGNAGGVRRLPAESARSNGGSGGARSPGGARGGAPAFFPVFLNAIGLRDRRDDIDGLVAASLQPVGAAYAELLQPLIDRVEASPNLARAQDIIDSWHATEEALAAFGERMAETLFPAAMMGLEPIRDGIPAATVNDQAPGFANAARRVWGWVKGRGSAPNPRRGVADSPAPSTMRGDTAEAAGSPRGAILPAGRIGDGEAQMVGSARFCTMDEVRAKGEEIIAESLDFAPFPPGREATGSAAEGGTEGAPLRGGPPSRSAACNGVSEGARSLGGVRGGAPALLLRNAPAAEYNPLPFDEAREFWASKRLVADFADLEALDATWLQARALGFKIAGITETSALRMIHADLDRAVKGETSVDALVRIMRDKYGLGSRHAENIVRTNVQSAYQWGHYQQMDAVRETFPIWAFDVVEDASTSDICAPLAGLAYPADHEIWSSAYPPNHYQCRTTVVPLTPEEAADQGFRIQKAWPRDSQTGQQFAVLEGFAGNIGTVGLSDIVGGVAA